jgi:predicted kinase
LEATLLRSELRPAWEDKSLSWAGYELMTTLAERQFVLDQSVILDSVASTQTIRSIWFQLAKQYNADWRVIECVCSDETLHRSRLNMRRRNIPSWHELEWSDVEKVKHYYPAWQKERLILDMVNPFETNLFKARAYCE